MSRLAYERAIRRSDLPAPARHIALTIATWADIGTGLIPDRFQPSLATLADATGLHPATVKRHLLALVAAGWMVRDVRRQAGRSDHEVTRTTLTIPAGLQGEEGEEVGAQSANPPQEVGAERANGRRTERQGLAQSAPRGRRTERHKSSLSTGSTYRSPRPPASEHRDHPETGRPDATTKTTITQQLDAAADAARRELTKATGREIRPEWARKVAASILDASKHPVDDTAAYVARAIQREQTVSRFLPTHTGNGSNGHEAFADTEAARPVPALRPVQDPPAAGGAAGDRPDPDTVKSFADTARAAMAALRQPTTGETA